MEKYIDINEEGCSVRCKLYYEDLHTVRRAVLFGHGFGGHKDNKAAEKFARYVLSKYKNLAVMTFDWPCHGADARKKLSLEDCNTYLRLCTRWLRERLGAEELYAYATSFGGYLFLKYISESENPFRRLAFRCPAVNMYDVITGAIMQEEDLAKVEKGKDILVGFDRKIKISRDFLQEVKAADITLRDFSDFCGEILILQGTKDEIVPFAAVEAFADQNLLDFEAVENADHRFIDPKIMERAIIRIADFFDLR